MRVLLAPNSFKGSCSAIGAANAMEKGILKAIPGARIEKVPLSDGGNGFLETVKLIDSRVKICRAKVTGPMGKKVHACYGILKNTGIIEMAQASGMHLVPPAKRNPLLAATFGTGQLIKAVINRNVKRIILGIGGSATVDGGIGCLQALGVKFTGKNGKEIGLGGKELLKIRSIDVSGIDKHIKDIEFIIVCDVRNPIYGKNGAAFVYGPQKGAGPRAVKMLDKGLRNYARTIKRDIGVDIGKTPGAGAAGGIGAGLAAIAGAKLKNGMKVIADLAGLESKIRKSDLVITGEGKIDRQTVWGKAPIGVSKIAKKYRIPVIAICGSTGRGFEAVYKHGIDSVISITGPSADLSYSMKHAEYLIEKATERVFRILKKTGSFS